MRTTARPLSLLLFALPTLTAILALGPDLVGRNLVGQDLSGGSRKMNLDLPFDAVVDLEVDDDEDAPEIVEFYGQVFEGDGTFLVIDRSGTMQDRGELEIARREAMRMVSEFSNRMYFGLVFFDQAILKYPTSGRATQAAGAAKTAAIAWLQTVQGGAGTCCQEALMAGLTFANSSPSKRKVIVYVGDGGGTCMGHMGQSEGEYLTRTLAAFRGANFQRVPCNVIAVLDVGPIQESFLRQLSTTSGGSYVFISR